MVRISAGSIHDDINARLISTLASAKKLYSYAEYLGTIELCALHSEMLANYLCMTSKEILLKVIGEMSEEDRDIINKEKDNHKIYISNPLGQTLRLRWLEKGNIISCSEKKNLIKIHQMRIKYFHRWSTKKHNQKLDALKALVILSPISAKFLELLGSGEERLNHENINRIRCYMTLVQSI